VPKILEPSQTARHRLFAEGVPMIRHLTGLSDRSARSGIGLLMKEAKDDAARVLEIIRRAIDLRPIDPMAWLRAAVKAEPKRHLPADIMEAFLAAERDAADGRQCIDGQGEALRDVA
jgi:hypothetical protein